MRNGDKYNRMSLKSILLFFIFTFSFLLSAQAQRIHAFVSSGMTASQIEGDELRNFKKYGYSGGVGVLTSLGDKSNWGLSVETLFSQRGSRSTGDTRNYLYRMDLTVDYVDIPVMVHWQDPHGGMLVGLGLNYGRIVSQPHGRIGYDSLFFMPDTTDMTFLPNEFAFVADARFTIWRGLQLGIRWQHSLLPVKRDWNFYKYNGYEVDANGVRHDRWITTTNDCYNHSITVRLIYQF